MNWYLKVMRQYFDVSGRARRTEYWMYFLVYLGIAIVAGLLDSFTKGQLIGGLVALVHLIPSVTVGVRRLHDIGRSGWWLLVALIPLIGWLIALYWAVKEGDAQDNAYGSNPKTAD
ncbi:Uncharacterized membrane protein YhaH, DUF805 family [Polaromonas sp. OV174]|uniref:DUF805 domain-containing protein n=1 Tax=Polaromonas sp. OV174 TaxID=1855300 RepID=UPI0008F40439|nr:DUF805 domain-containing protein [Polaromonas sp. OV174]SFC71782.1 Uncharacterized membrane protein YhaH, DUF805 family [Polaromonas sp. OV174]